MSDDSPEKPAESEAQSDKLSSEAVDLRHEQAFELYRDGKSYREIAEQLGYARPNGACKAVIAHEKKLLQRESAAVARAMILARDEKVIARAMEELNDPEGEWDIAANVLLKVNHQLARIMGLYEPEQHELLGGAEIVLEVVGGTEVRRAETEEGSDDLEPQD